MNAHALAILLQGQTQLNIQFFDIDFERPPDTIPSIAEILCIKYLGHHIYGVYHQTDRSLALIMVYPGLFKYQEDADKLVTAIRGWYPIGKLSFVGATRFYGDPLEQCNSQNALRAMLVAAAFLLVAIKCCDIDTICPVRESQQPAPDVLSSLNSDEFSQPDVSSPQPESDIVEVLEDDEDDHYDNDLPESDAESILLDVDVEVCEPVASLSSSQNSSQQTIILSITANSQSLADRHDPSWPYHRVHAVTPRTDIDNSILNNRRFLMSELDLIIKSFNLPLSRLPPSTGSNALEKILSYSGCSYSPLLSKNM